jgi:hypothetical protein
MVLAFLGIYFVLFSIASVFRPSSVAEIFVTPDLQAVLFFAFFMLDDPPTSPVRYEDQLMFGAIVATVSYVIFMRFGGVYFLPAGLLAGNVWESGRRLAMARIGKQTRIDTRRIQVLTGAGIAALVLPMAVALAIGSGEAPTSAGGARQASASQATAEGASQASSSPTASTQDRYPFLNEFADDLSGSFTQTRDSANARLVMDGKATGEFPVGLHVELVQSSVVPTPDDESAESVPDDEDAEARPVVTITLNSAQLLDPVSNSLLCDGQLTALNRGVMRFNCAGKAGYDGVTMQISSELDAAEDGTISGSLNGSMNRTS